MVTSFNAVVESHVGGRGRIRGDRHGSKWLSPCDRTRIRDDFPLCSMPIAVEQGRQSEGNPDALLFLVGAPGSGAVDPHYCAGHDALNGNAWRLGAARRIAPDQHSHWRNKHGRGRSDDR